MNVVVNGLMVNYQKVGKGKTLVFLHGWGDTADTFSAIADQLKDEYQIYALDLPGFGGTQVPSETWGLEDYAEFLKAWILKLDIKVFGLVGHSYGGAVAIIAASRSNRIKKLILIASAGIRNKKPLRKKLLNAGTKVGKIPLYALPPHKRRQIKQRLYGSIGSEVMLVPHMEDTFRNIISQDVRRTAAKINLPTLLVYGTHDRQTPVADGRILNAAMAGSQLEIIDASHFLHQEKSTEVSELMRRFLGKADD